MKYLAAAVIATVGLACVGCSSGSSGDVDKQMRALHDKPSTFPGAGGGAKGPSAPAKNKTPAAPPSPPGG